MADHYRQWIKVTLFNLILIALLGLLMRYKIVFSMPWLHQKHILHAHSHFAFSGWITQLLMILMISKLGNDEQIFFKYRRLLLANLITAYGMLFSFPFQGYGLISISFSTLSILVSYTFVIQFCKDSQGKLTPAFKWFRAALIFLLISSLGAFSLSFLMANKIMSQQWYLASVYFFLHFQYNGWFFFACMGLLFEALGDNEPTRKYHHKIFRLFFASCIPAYFLSILWADLPFWLYLTVIAAAISQVIGGIYLWKVISVRRNHFSLSWSRLSQRTGLLVLLALSIKLCLQLFSTVPALSDLAYGFRPIVIGYLHLVLLGIISLFLLTFIIKNLDINALPLLRKGLIFFIAGILSNELVLMLQGLFAMTYTVIPYINQLLLLIAFILFAGSTMIFFGFRKHTMRTSIK